MRSRYLLFQQLIAQIERQRPRVAADLRAHQADLMIAADTQVPDAVRFDALRRAGAATIYFALNQPGPMGSSVEDQRLRADLQLLHGRSWWRMGHAGSAPRMIGLAERSGSRRCARTGRHSLSWLASR